MLACALTAWASAQITNGDFESGFDNGWSSNARNGAVATFSEETTDPHGGSKALKSEITTVTTTAWDAQTLGPTLSLTIGEEYTLSFWAKTDVAGQSMRVVVQGSIYTGKSFNIANEVEKKLAVMKIRSDLNQFSNEPMLLTLGEKLAVMK